MTDNENDSSDLSYVVAFDTSQPLPEKYRDPPGRYKWSKNGVVYDTQTGRFVDNTWSVTKAGPKRGRAMAVRAEQLKLQAQMAAREGVALRVSGKKECVLEAWSMIVGAQAEMAANPTEKTASASTKAAEFVGRAAGLLVDQRRVESSAGQDKAAQIGRAFLDALAERIDGIDLEDDDEDDGEEYIDAEFAE